MKKLLCSLILSLTLVSGGIAAAAVDAVYTGFFSSKAIRGYDVVAYFTEGMPVEGSNQFSFDYMGAQWKFSSQQHLDMFRVDPEMYAPQYGGYCAYAMANGDTASAEPDLWTIVEGKLYLNYSRRINARWKEDRANYIQQADIIWPQFEKK
ncbi:MAG: YHS domain-containing protein [Proteobacteria bacterium]|nr:YHS domain-containing protein [Pseudomonadota bacterium]